MALIDLRCLTCGHTFEAHRAIADWPATPPCESCGAATEQQLLPPRTRWTVDPVVVFRAPDGTFRFPGDANGASAAAYARQGFDRIELRNVADVRHFEHHMNARELSLAHRRVERLQQMREQRESETRSELRRLMPSMSAFGRALARAAQGRNDAKPRERARDAGFHVDVYSNDRSNRDESRDAQGRRRRD